MLVHLSFLPERRSFAARQGGLRTHLTSANALFSFGLTGRPEVGKLMVSKYQPSRQTGFGCSMKASLLTKRGFRAFTPTSNYTVALPGYNFQYILRLFRFCIYFAIRPSTSRRSALEP
jgi:hypothetical protein